jgi:hypothetical protein
VVAAARAELHTPRSKQVGNRTVGSDLDPGKCRLCVILTERRALPVYPDKFRVRRHVSYALVERVATWRYVR